MRAVSTVAGLAWKRLRRRDSGAFVAILGLVVATTVLAGVLAGVTIATDRSVAQAIERIPASERSVRAVWFGVPGDSGERLASLDRAVEDAYPGVDGGQPTPLVLFRESTVAGRFVGITAVDGVAEHVILRSGRLPRTCTAERCEVLRLRGRGGLPDAPGLRLVQVGTANLRSTQLFGDFLLSGDAAVADATVPPELGDTSEYHRPPPPPLVVAEGRAALANAPLLARTYRAYAWVSPLGPGSPRFWEIDELVARTERARVELTERSSSFGVDVPVEELREAERAANVAGTRLLLVGGEGAVLLLAFTILAARGMRRDLEAARRRLTWLGAQRWQLWLLSGLESSAVAFVGVVLGWVGGVAVAGVVARRGRSAGRRRASRERPVDTRPRARSRGLCRRSRARLDHRFAAGSQRRPCPGTVDLVAAASVLVVAVALLSGAADEEQLARGEDTALLLLLLPGLIAIAAALVVARVLPSLARLRADRRRGGLPSRMAAVGLARGPGAAVATVAFLTIAFAVALLAGGYRATLVEGDRDQAAFQVPHDVVVRENLRNLVRVFDAAPIERFDELAGPDGAARPVLRVTGSAGRAERVTGITVLGLDRDAIEEVGVWRDDWADGRGRTELASLVSPDSAMEMAGLPLQDGRIALDVGPGLVSLAAIVRSGDGSFRRVELGEARPRVATRLTARVPTGSLLTALEIVPPPRLIERGADAGVAFFANVRLSGPTRAALPRLARGGRVGRSADAEWCRRPRSADLAANLRAARGAADGHVAPRRAREPAPGRARRRRRRGASAAGRRRSVPVRVAGTVERFPGTEDLVVVGDRTALRTAVNAVAPGAARENEVWLDVSSERADDVARALTRPPFRVLQATLRTDVEAEAGRDPLAQGTLLALVGTAGVALLLAALGLALAVRADLRDDSGEHFDLEAQGASPAFLRRVVRIRAATVSAVGLVGGIVTGLALLLLVTRVVTVTARGGDAEPPLAVVVDPLLVVAGIAVFAVLAALLVGRATRHAFAGTRGPAYRETE